MRNDSKTKKCKVGTRFLHACKHARIHIISYIAGRKIGIDIVKVFLKYYDPNAIIVFKENANIEIVTIAERIEQLSEQMKNISNFEKIKPAVEIAEKNRFGRVIHDNAGYLCANYTNVVGLGISIVVNQELVNSIEQIVYINANGKYKKEKMQFKKMINKTKQTYLLKD